MHGTLKVRRVLNRRRIRIRIQSVALIAEPAGRGCEGTYHHQRRQGNYCRHHTAEANQDRQFADGPLPPLPDILTESMNAASHAGQLQQMRTTKCGTGLVIAYQHE